MWEGSSYYRKQLHCILKLSLIPANSPKSNVPFCIYRKVRWNIPYLFLVKCMAVFRLATLIGNGPEMLGQARCPFPFASINCHCKAFFFTFLDIYIYILIICCYDRGGIVSLSHMWSFFLFVFCSRWFKLVPRRLRKGYSPVLWNRGISVDKVCQLVA